MYQGVEPRQYCAPIGKSGNNPQRIVEPCAFDGGLKRLAQVNGSRLVLRRRAEPDLPGAVGGRSGGDDRVAVNRHGEDEAVVVIGVLADDVDAARGGGNPLRWPAIELFEPVCDVSTKFLKSHGLL